jgi:hypothetical protein
MKPWFTALLLFYITPALAQPLAQVVRGRVTDRDTKAPLPGAAVFIPGSEPLVGAVTNADGDFVLPRVPVGRHPLRCTLVGYEPYQLAELLVGAGKEVVLDIGLAEAYRQIAGVEVTASGQDKDKPLNEMAVVSARTFSVEETQRYAAAFNDPARMAASYAGVVSSGDFSNEIVVRGNSPGGLLWRLEGVEIPSPNHFSNEGASGGGIGIISAQLLANSDFMTGAFPAEYGNALSGVFDINLRRGNNQRREWTAQASVVGLDLAAEGPFSRRGAATQRASFLANYRYSTLSVLSGLGLPLPGGVLIFQDLSFNLTFPTKKLGVFSLFGIGGLSAQRQLPVRDSLAWRTGARRNGQRQQFGMGAVGLSHQASLGAKTYLKTTLALTGSGNGEYQWRLGSRYEEQPTRDNRYLEQRLTLGSLVNHKFNARHLLRAGFFWTRHAYDLLTQNAPQAGRPLVASLDEQDAAATFQAYAQWKYRVLARLTLLAGAHYLRFGLNGRESLEPRASLQWQLGDKSTLSAGFGVHSRILPLGTYFARVQVRNVGPVQPNLGLDMTKAHHWVLAYDRLLRPDLRAKAEVYYQQLYGVPIRPGRNQYFSLLNQASGFVGDSLVSQGTGRNYGLELTVEKFFSNNYYFLLANSLYDSKYFVLDGQARNTRYNGNFVLSLLGGKEFVKARTNRRQQPVERVWGVNLRVVWSGGFRYTPIDLARSRRDNTERRFEDQAFQAQLPHYFRLDFRVSLKKDRPGYTRTLSLDVQNLTDRRNVARQYYDPSLRGIATEYQLSILPVLAYRVEF